MCCGGQGTRVTSLTQHLSNEETSRPRGCPVPPILPLSAIPQQISLQKMEPSMDVAGVGGVISKWRLARTPFGASLVGWIPQRQWPQGEEKDP